MSLKRTLMSNIFINAPLCDQKFQATFVDEKSLYADPRPLHEFIQSCSQSTSALGIAGAYVACTDDSQRDGTACLLTRLAVATADRVLVITLHFGSEDPADIVDHTLLYDNLFSETNPRSYIGFNVDRVALQLFGEYGLWIREGREALSTGIDSIDSARTPRAFAKTNKTVIATSSFLELLRDESDIEDNDNILATRAWVGAMLEQASENLAVALSKVPPINLYSLSVEELKVLKQTLQSSDRLRGAAPDFQEHDVAIERSEENYFAISNQFNTRVRMTELELEIAFEHTTVIAKVISHKGRRAKLKLTENVDLNEAGEIVSATTLGKEEATTLDHQRSNLILFALQGRAPLLANEFLKQIWFPDLCSSHSQRGGLTVPELFGDEWKRLNRSQLVAVQEMLVESPDPRIVLIHGPPGTGKTSVIAAMTQSLLLSGISSQAGDEDTTPAPDNGSEDSEEESSDEGPTVWIIAQSNVAVKNVAEKLIKVGIEQFKLVVSQDFHFDWHEHLYQKLKAHTCTKFPDNKGEVITLLRGVRVVLCTLSMITSRRMRKLGFHDIVPVTNVVVDEASQIQLGDLLPLFHIFGDSIKRICLVGDHKQLAPYGQEQVEDIESIFEKKHIVANATFLNITYRLPKPISNIISAKVYDSDLIPNSQEERPTCCKFIDVPGEEIEESKSYVNEAEVEAVILMARELESKKKDYRIISPYASQTAAILKRLKEEEMPKDDKCFNVDSFQGNEADYIIISLVRTERMGFLDNNRRANVLLTRCKKGMFVMCSKELLMSKQAQPTLLGQFASRWDSEQDSTIWPSHQDLIDGHEMVDEDLEEPAPERSSAPPPASYLSEPTPKSQKKERKSKKEDPVEPQADTKSPRRKPPRAKGKNKKTK